MECEKRYEQGFKFNLNNYTPLECQCGRGSKGINQTRTLTNNGDDGEMILMITVCEMCRNVSRIWLDADY